MNFEDTANTAIGSAEHICRHLLPDGFRRGGVWVARNPRRDDRNLGSFKISLGSGVWKDYASDDKGGDLISLWAFVNNVPQIDALRGLQSFLSLKVDTPPQRKVKTSHGGNSAWIPQSVGPEGVQPNFKHWEHGLPSKVWTYRTPSGVAGYVCRFDFANGAKEVLPFVWLRNGDRTGWQYRGFAQPQPLYNLDLLANWSGPVVLVEGEKSADSATAIFDGQALGITWQGGGKAFHRTDFAPLAGREVLLWPDADPEGEAAGDAIHKTLVDLGATVARIRTEGFPKGYDIADAQQEGFTADMVLRLLKPVMTDLCRLCFARSIIAPMGGATCTHNGPFEYPDGLDFCAEAGIPLGEI